jgi:hypothetical protein
MTLLVSDGEVLNRSVVNDSENPMYCESLVSSGEGHSHVTTGAPLTKAAVAVSQIRCKATKGETPYF